MVDCGSVLKFEALFKFGEDEHCSNYIDGGENDCIPIVHCIIWERVIVINKLVVWLI